MAIEAIERAYPIQSPAVEMDGFYAVGKEVYEDIKGKEKGRRTSPYFKLRVVDRFVSAVLEVEPLAQNLSDQQLAKIAETNPQVIQRSKEKALKNNGLNGHKPPNEATST